MSMTQIVLPSSVRSSTTPRWHSTPSRLRLTTSPSSRADHVAVRRLCRMTFCLSYSWGCDVVRRVLTQWRVRAMRPEGALVSRSKVPGGMQKGTLLTQSYRRLLTITRRRIRFPMRRANRARSPAQGTTVQKREGQIRGIRPSSANSCGSLYAIISVSSLVAVRSSTAFCMCRAMAL